MAGRGRRVPSRDQVLEEGALLASAFVWAEVAARCAGFFRPATCWCVVPCPRPVLSRPHRRSLVREVLSLSYFLYTISAFLSSHAGNRDRNGFRDPELSPPLSTCRGFGEKQKMARDTLRQTATDRDGGATGEDPPATAARQTATAA